jgi:uncharacterized protein DUF1761
MQPEIHVNYLAIVAAIAANMVIGFLWYGPVFGSPWRKEMGVAPDAKPAAGAMRRSLILMVIGTFLMAWVLSYDIAVWRPSSWKAGADQAAATYGFLSAFFIWLGYIVPLLLGSVAWENKSWKLFAINAGYWFIALLAMGMILAYWR